jgi:hypothetical protein
MENHIYTEDLARYGYRERVELEKILHAWNEHGLPSEFYDNEVRPAFNMNSGYVFLVNSDYQVAMLNGDRLEIWHTTPYNGHEGFIEDLIELDPDTLNSEDIEYIRQYAPEYGLAA